LQELAKVSVSNLRDVKIVYSPLHGVGAFSLLPAFKNLGFTDVHMVADQEEPNGDFPNIEKHIGNPEVPAAMEHAKALAEQLDADIALATDPDADRLGCVSRRTVNGKTDWALFTGNQVGALIAYFVTSQLKMHNQLPQDKLIVKTAVTSDLITRIAEHMEVGCVSDLLVGFKYVAAVINSLEKPDRFLLGLEESLGYLSNPNVHDKDAANAAILLAEAAATMKAQNSDLWAMMEEIYQHCGYFKEHLENHMQPGKSGQADISKMMEGLRKEPITELGGMKVVRITDRLRNTVTTPEGTTEWQPTQDPTTGKIIESLVPARDNLLIYELAGDSHTEGAWVAVRPSGTEPKCKFYISAWTKREPGSEVTHMKSHVNEQTMALRDAILKEALRFTSNPA
jgi:phosphomannomutase